jgi:lysophospholipase L1-like esterase
MMNRLLLYTGFAVLLVVALVGLDAAVLAATNGPPRAHHYYLALGDSLAFGFQPNLDFTDGYADDVFAELSQTSDRTTTVEEINYACAGETTTSMVQGGCIGRYGHHGFYTGPQLDAAVAFLRGHPGQVSPVTLDIGANDALPDFDQSTCQPTSSAAADVATMDQNLTKSILPALTGAMQTTMGLRTGDLVMLNYYDPFAQECPTSLAFARMLNQHLAADAAPFRVPVVDVYSAFGGDTMMAQNVCQGPLVNGQRQPYTWICNTQFHDFHPMTYGYQLIATAIEQALALPGTNPLPGIVPPLGYIPSEAARRRPAGASA